MLFKTKSASSLFNFQNMIRSHQIHPLVTLFCLLTDVSFELFIGSSELSNCSQFVSTLTTELLSFFLLLPRGLNWFLPPEIKLPINLGCGLVSGSHPRLCPRSWSRFPDYPSIPWVLPPCHPCPPCGHPGWSWPWWRCTWCGCFLPPPRPRLSGVFLEIIISYKLYKEFYQKFKMF